MFNSVPRLTSYSSKKVLAANEKGLEFPEGYDSKE